MIISESNIETVINKYLNSKLIMVYFNEKNFNTIKLKKNLIHKKEIIKITKINTLYKINFNSKQPLIFYSFHNDEIAKKNYYKKLVRISLLYHPFIFVNGKYLCKFNNFNFFKLENILNEKNINNSLLKYKLSSLK